MGGDANVAARVPGGWDRIRQSIREEQANMPVLASAPMLVQETLIFPYLSGAEFMRNFQTRSPGKDPFRDLPLSTEQILHTASYFDGKRDVPVALTLPPLPGTAAYENTLGEFETRLFLFQHLGDQNAAIRGAAGWGGDRYALVDTPRGQGLVWLTVWDTPIDAAEFNDLLGQAVQRRDGVRAPATSADASGAKSFEASGRRVTVTAGEVQGRAAVLLADMPAGASTAAVDLSKAGVR
jgi:hypothetical protein